MSILLDIQPATALIDVPAAFMCAVCVRANASVCRPRGARAGGPVGVGGEFSADAAGTVDLGRDAPISGSYSGVSPMGLIWSQCPRDRAAHATPSQRKPSAPCAQRSAC